MKKTLKISFGNSKELLGLSKNKTRKILWALGKDAFMLILIFVLLSLLFGEFLFYRYVVMSQLQEPDMVTPLIKFQENLYNSVLKEWQERQNTFENSSQKNHIDPFQKN